MKFNFDEVIDRNDTNSMNVELFKKYVFRDADVTLPYPKEEYVRMWLADMEFATPPSVTDAIRERLDKKILGYTGIYDNSLYDAYSYWTKKYYGWAPKKEHLRTSPGIVFALIDLVRYFVAKDEKVIFFTPSYGWFKNAAVRAERDYVCCPLTNDNGNYSMDLTAFESMLDSDRSIKLCIFCSPHNPTGRVWTNEEMVQFVDICARYDVHIIWDEIHCDLTRIGVTHEPMAKVCDYYDKITTCMSLSKTLNIAGLALSTIIIPNDESRAVWDRRHLGNENPLSLAGAIGGYYNSADWLLEMRGYLDDNFKMAKEYFDKNLPHAVFNIPQATYLGWLDLSAYVDESVNLPLFFCTKTKVMIEGGDISFVDNAQNFIRINFAQPREIVKNGIELICDAINQHYPVK